MHQDFFKNCHLISDIDGTLASTDDFLPQANRDAIAHFVAHGGTFSIATGRYLGDLDVLNGVAINGLCILNNGACIYDMVNQREISAQVLPAGALSAALDFCYNHPAVGLLAVTPDGYFTVALDALDRPVLHSRYPVRTVAQLRLPLHKLLFVSHETQTTATLAQLRSASFSAVEFVQTGAHSIEMTPQHVSKGNAFAKICQMQGIATQNTYFIGDSFNDVSMMEQAGFSAAVGDAPPAVQQHADVVLGDFADGVVAEFIAYIARRIVAEYAESL